MALSGHRTLCLGITDTLDANNTKWDSDFVTQATQKLLDEFEALPDRDPSEFVAELARRVALLRTTCHQTTIWWRPPIACFSNSIVASSLNDIAAPGRGLVGRPRHGGEGAARPRQSRFEAAASVSFLRVGVFDAQNLVTIPHAKLIRSLGKLGGAELAAVERAVYLWLGLPTTSSEA